MVTACTATSDTRQRATAAVRAMNAESTHADARTQADRYLRDIAANGSDSEKIIAQAARTATAQRLSPQSAHDAQRVILTVLAAGVSGPMAQVLADLGCKAVAEAQDYEDGRSMAGPFLDAIGKNSPEAAERVLAATASQAGAERLSQESGCRVRHEALKMLRSTSKNSPEVVLIDFGKRMPSIASDAEDARHLGHQVLSALHSIVSDPVAKTVAAVAMDAAGRRVAHATGRDVQAAAFRRLANGVGGDIEPHLLALGEQAMHDSVDREDARTVGSAYVQALAQRTSDPRIRVYATVAHTVAAQRLANASGATLLELAVSEMKRGLGDDVEKRLAWLGMNGAARAFDQEDARAIGRTVLASIGTLSPHAAVRDMADTARKAGESVQPDFWRRLLKRSPDPEAVKLHQKGLQAVIELRDLVEKKLAADKEARQLRELQDMADALQPRPGQGGGVTIEDEAVVIGGVRVQRNRPSEKDPSGSAASGGVKVQAFL